ncbi:MAG: cation:dicarboxylase symporter family transporter [Candidatus Acidiferrales bacterium]
MFAASTPMPSEPRKRGILIALLSGILGATFLSLFSHAGNLQIPPDVSATARWIVIALLAAHAGTRRSLTAWILAGMAAGAELGFDAPAIAVHFQVLGSIFLRLIKVIIAPLLFGTLVVGIAGHADLKKVGRMGIKAIVYFEIVSTIAILIGLAAINLSRAGVGIHLPTMPGENLQIIAPHTASELILNAFPENIAKSIAEGQVLQVVIFSILFGMALAMVPEAKRRPLIGLAESLSETMFKFTNLVMLAAPIGVFGAIAYAVGHMGLGILLPLLKLLGTMYVALIVFVTFVLLPIAYFARIPIARFTRAAAEPVAIAFATASSEAALPRAMENMEALGVPRSTVAFVLPTGYSFNLDGSSLYQSLALIFIAQAAGMHLTLGQQFVMMLTLLLSSKGTAGVARASLVIVLAAATQFRLPIEPFFLLFGIDQLMDMPRTAVNVLGNCLATAVVARWEGEFPPKKA